ncbi:serine-protein kinase ATM-like [Styela clava]
MSGKLTELFNNCSLLDSSKITDQNKGLNGIKLFIEDSELVSRLNESTDFKKGWKWNQVFKTVYNYLEKESGTLSKQYESWALSTRNNKIKKVQDVLILTKRILQIANVDLVRIKVTGFLNFLINCLHSNLFRLNYGVMILSLIDKEILAEKKYICDLTKEVYDNLFKICMLELTQEGNETKFASSVLLRSLTHALVLQSVPSSYHNLHSIFVNVIKGLTNVKTPTIWENVLTAVNLYIKWYAVSYRISCCQLGEDCIDTIICIWIGNLLPESTLGQVIEFCSRQITLHHPRGSIDPSSCAYAKDYATWHTQLFSILLGTEMQLSKQSCSLSYRLKTDRTVVFNKGCIQLAASACSVLFDLHLNQKFKGQKSTPNQVGDLLLNKINFDDKSSFSIIFSFDKDKKVTNAEQYWMEILSCLLQGNEEFLNVTVALKIAAQFQHLITKVNLNIIGIYCLKCLSIVFKTVSCHIPKVLKSFDSELAIIWKDCWNVATTFLSQATKSVINNTVLDLLTTLVRLDGKCKANFFIATRCVKNTQSLWSSIYLHIEPNDHSLKFVKAFIDTYGLNSTQDDNNFFCTLLQMLTVNPTFMNCEPYRVMSQCDPLCVLLLLWILGYKEEDSDSSSRQQSFTKSENYSQTPLQDSPKLMPTLNIVTCKSETDKIDTAEIAQLLLGLCQKSIICNGCHVIKYVDSISSDTVNDSFVKFHNPEFVAVYKYFSDDTRNAKEVDPSQAPANRSLHKHVIEFVFHILKTDLYVISSRAADLPNENNPNDLYSLLKAFFTIANIAGNLLKEISVVKGFEQNTQQISDAWIAHVTDMIKTTLCCLNKWPALQSNSDLMMMIFHEFEKVVAILQALPFDNTDSEIVSCFHSICEIALSILKLGQTETGSSNLRGRSSSSLDTMGDDFDLTQSSLSRSSMGQSSGYKRRRYGTASGDTKPISKQIKRSKYDDDNVHCSCDKTQSLYAFCDCKTLYCSAMLLLCKVQKVQISSGFVKSALELVHDLQLEKFANLKLVYSMLNQFSSGCISSADLTAEALDLFHDVFSSWYKDQFVCSKFLHLLAKVVSNCHHSDTSDVIEKTVKILNIFWKLSLKGKCSPLVQMGIASCLYFVSRIQLDKLTTSISGSLMKEDLSELDFTNFFDCCFALMTFTSAPHDSVKFLCTSLIGSLFSSSQNHIVYKTLQNEVLLYIFESFENNLQKQISESDGRNAECFTSILSSQLHLIFAACPHSMPDIEERSHYLLCLLAQFCSKQNFPSYVKRVCKSLITSCFDSFAMEALNSRIDKDKINCEKHLFKYKARHLTGIIKRLVASNKTNLCNAVISLPSFVFGYENVQQLCVECRKLIFPILFLKSKSFQELETVVELFVQPSDRTSRPSLSGLVKACTPEILSLFFETKMKKNTFTFDERTVLSYFDDIFQTNGTIFALVQHHFAHILVEILMLIDIDSQGNADSNSFLSAIQCIFEYYVFPNAKQLQETSEEKLLGDLVKASFVRRSDGCLLVQILLNFRKHIDAAWYPSELFQKMKVYQCFVAAVLKAAYVPDDLVSYFIKDLVYVVSLYMNKLGDRFKVLPELGRIALTNGSVVCSDLFILLFEFTKTTPNGFAANCLNQWEIAVPIISSLRLLNTFSDKIQSDNTNSVLGVVKNSLEEKLQNLFSTVNSKLHSDTLNKLLALFDTPGTPDISDAAMCIDIVINSFEILKDHDMLDTPNPILDCVLGVLAKTLKEMRIFHSQISVSYCELQKVMESLLNLPFYKYPCTVNVYDCIAELCSFLPKHPPAKLVKDPDYTKSKLRQDILHILSKRITSFRYPLARDAIDCLYQLFQLQDVNDQMKYIKVFDSFVADVLTPFRLELSENLQLEFTQRNLDEMLTFLSQCYTFDNTYKDWICKLTSGLVRFTKSKMFHILTTVCSIDDQMCSAILPSVIHDVLVNDPTGKAKKCLSKYLEKCCKSFLISPKDKALIKNDYSMSMQTVLNILQFLRTQSISDVETNQKRHSGRAGVEKSKSSSWENNFWLDVSYLTAANVAVVCGQPYKAILFIEIWLERHTLQNTNPDLRVIDLTSDIGEKNTSSVAEKAESENILVKAFSIINDLDSLYGLQKNCTNHSNITIHVHEEERNWMEVLYSYNSQIPKSLFEVNTYDKILTAIEHSGLNHVSSTYLAGMQSQLANSQNVEARNWLVERQYEAAYKLNQWDHVPKLASSDLNKKGFQEKFFNCLSLMHDFDFLTISNIDALRQDTLASIPTFKSKLFHLDQEVLSCFAELVCLKELADVHYLLMGGKQSSFTDALSNWNTLLMNNNSILESSLHCSNLILSTRCNYTPVLQSKFVDYASVAQLHEFDEKNQMRQVSEMIREGRTRVALQKLTSMRIKFESDPGKSFKYHKTLMEEAMLLWKMCKKSEALSLSEKLYDSLKSNIANSVSTSRFELGYLLGRILLLRGEWLDSSKMEPPSTIMEDYFKKSVDLAERISKGKISFSISENEVQSLCISGYRSLAKYADNQYIEVITYMKSNEFEHKRNLVREAKQELEKAQSKNAPQNQKYLILLQKNFKMDHKVFNDIIEKKEKFLLCALENYVKCLSLSDCDDILMYRVCSLWFANTTIQSIPGLMDCACKQIKTYKFVQLSYQLAARLDAESSDTNFQSSLQHLLHRMALDHPHHVLPVIMALSNAYRDSEVIKPNSKKLKTQNSTSIAAKGLISQVKSTNPVLVESLANISDAYIQLANYDASRWSKMSSVPVSFDKSLLISKYCTTGKNDAYASLAIPTVELPIEKSCNYEGMSNFVSLRCFKPYFSLCGGINLPKIVVAIGSDGRERKHLVKGRDDLRQDAVMQQVFKVVNTLLVTEKRTKNQLQLRTYKVIPLSQRSGLVEWCERTIPIGTYLIGTPSQKDYGAHHKYRPNNSLSLECRRKLSAASGKPIHQKLEVFKDICKNFKPVFRHFFYENFIDPLHWYERRTAYCRSVATSSVVGYILGLGDRHVQNILIDQSTGEVIHIDLGVAFEQGRCLPTPEMVPFRLTRDMVDGFGSSGVEGSFRRNCERTMNVLRNSVETISTIVEVLLHDPLHDWMMTSGKAMQIQKTAHGNQESEMTSSILNASTVAELLNDNLNTTTAVNRSSLAGRALLRVQEKLRGLESGAVLSVEGQINLLIQQATDFERLCAMFAGWQPYI